jgi:hypothetical protein
MALKETTADELMDFVRSISKNKKITDKNSPEAKAAAKKLIKIIKLRQKDLELNPEKQRPAKNSKQDILDLMKAIAEKARVPETKQKRIDATESNKEMIDRIRTKILEQRTREAAEQEADVVIQRDHQANVQLELATYKRNLYETLQQFTQTKTHLTNYQALSNSQWPAQTNLDLIESLLLKELDRVETLDPAGRQYTQVTYPVQERIRVLPRRELGNQRSSNVEYLSIPQPPITRRNYESN